MKGSSKKASCERCSGPSNSGEPANGELKEVMFPQRHEPGHQAQSDFTFMNSLGVTARRATVSSSALSTLWGKRERSNAVSVFSQGSFEIRRWRWILRSCRSATSISDNDKRTAGPGSSLPDAP